MFKVLYEVGKAKIVTCPSDFKSSLFAQCRLGGVAAEPRRAGLVGVPGRAGRREPVPEPRPGGSGVGVQPGEHGRLLPASAPSLAVTSLCLSCLVSKAGETVGSVQYCCAGGVAGSCMR